MRKLFVLLVVVFVYTSCRKYEEDPYTVIFKFPEKRIEGEWIYKSILINGIDSTDAIVEKDKWGWEFGKDYRTSYLFFRTKFNNMTDFSYYWEFSDSNKKIMIFNKSAKNVTKIHWDVGYPVYWEIKALNKKKMKIKSEPINNNVYEIEFYRK